MDDVDNLGYIGLDETSDVIVDVDGVNGDYAGMATIPEKMGRLPWITTQKFPSCLRLVGIRVDYLEVLGYAEIWLTLATSVRFLFSWKFPNMSLVAQ